MIRQYQVSYCSVEWGDRPIWNKVHIHRSLWFDEGTGPLSSEEAKIWRDKPHCSVCGRYFKDDLNHTEGPIEAPHSPVCSDVQDCATVAGPGKFYAAVHAAEIPAHLTTTDADEDSLEVLRQMIGSEGVEP